MHPDKIKMSIGGERLEDVIGRRENDELPVFDAGAFDVEIDEKRGKLRDRKLVSNDLLDLYMPQVEEITKHTMRDLIRSIRLVHTSEFQCSEVKLFCFYLLNSPCI